MIVDQDVYFVFSQRQYKVAALNKLYFKRVLVMAVMYK